MTPFILLALACAPVQPSTPAPAAGLLADMRAQPLELTRHGECRMACRHISQSEVEQVLRDGTIDPSRTRLDGECPSHAVESTTKDGQHVRVVFAACASETRVVTAIDLDTEWPCDCP